MIAMQPCNVKYLYALFIPREAEEYKFEQLPGGYWRRVGSNDELPAPGCAFTTENLVSSGYTPSCIFDFEFQGKKFSPSSGKSWKTTSKGVATLTKCSRIIATGQTARYILKFDDYPVMRMTNLWSDMTGASDKIYAVQTSEKAIERCMLMTTDPGDLAFDPTCGSGTMASVAEKWGRRWITCDTSRVAVTLAKQRLMTASYDYYELRYPHEGLRGGFMYKTVPHVTLKSIANNSEIDQIYERLHPAIDATLLGHL